MSLDRSTMLSDAERMRRIPPPAGDPTASGPRIDLAETARSGERPVLKDTSPGARDETDPTVHRKIGRFLLLESIGAGGMGVVHAAFDPELDRRIAVKLLRRDRGRDYSETRFLREAQAMARLSHPNVVQIYDTGVVDGQVYIAMELVDGRTAGDWLTERPRTWREIVDVYLQAGRGLAAAHDVGLVHRDFKPDNVLIGADGRVRVADFGLARGDTGDISLSQSDVALERGALLSASLTSAGTVMGTPAYMSPEQHLGRDVGPASDQFSFCVALYEALCGRRPFAGSAVTELTDNVLHGRVLDPPSGTDAPQRILDLLRRGLQPDPAARHRDMDALLRALAHDPSAIRRRWLGGLTTAALATTLGWSLSPGAAPDVCTGGAAIVADAWNPARRDAVEAALRTLPSGDDVAARVLTTLDAYAAQWASVHRDTCLAHQRGERSSILLDAGMRCLAVRQAALDRAAELLAGGAPPALREATGVAARLPRIAACADPVALASVAPPPDDPAVAAAVVGLHARLARAGVLVTAGELARATDEAAQIRAEAGRLRYSPLIAEAALAEGRAAILSYQVAQARGALDEALVVALAARLDDVAAEAAARLLYVDGLALGRTDDALAARRVADALVQRTGDRPDLRALLANNLGAVHRARGESDSARALFREAVAAAAADPYGDPVERWNYQVNLATETADPAARAGLFAAAVAGLSHVLGDSHVHTLQVRRISADHTLDPAAAQAGYAAACPGLAAHRDLYDSCALCFLGQARAEDDLERPDLAAAAMERAAACLSVPLLPEDEAPMGVLRDLARGHAELLSGDPAAALLSLETAITAADPHREQPWIALRIAELQVARGRALLQLAREADAIAALTPAIAVLSERAAREFASLPHLQLARARVVLAEALARALARGTLPSDVTAADARRQRDVHLDAAQELYRRAGDGGARRLERLAAVRSLARAP